MEGGRWGLVIVASAFLIQVVAFGVSTSIGIYNIEFLDYFDNDTVGVSLISALNWATFLGTGPLCSFLMTKISFRKIALLGSVMVVVGIFLMPFLPSIPAFCICFGVLAGVGSCFVYVPSHVLSGLYYERHQSLSTGIATSGSGLGGAIMPIVIGNLIEYYGWRGSLIIVAGLELHLIVFAGLLRSPPVSKKKKSSDNEALLELTVPEKVVDSFSDGTTRAHIEDEVPRASLAVPEDMDSLMIEEHSQPSERNVDDTIIEANGVASTEDSAEGSVEPGDKPEQTDQDPDTCSGEKSRALSRHVTERNVKLLPHIYLFTDIGFDVYFISSILWNATAASVLAFGPELTAETGITPINSAWLLTILGLGNFVGGILGGVIGNIWVHRHIAQYIVANIVMGVCMGFLPFGSTFGEFAAIFLCGGLAFGVVLGLLVVVLIDLIGSENLGDGLGYVMLANGIGAFCGPALTGYIREETESYDFAFYLSGLMGVLSGAIMWLIPVLRRVVPPCKTSEKEVNNS